VERFAHSDPGENTLSGMDGVFHMPAWDGERFVAPSWVRAHWVTLSPF